MKNIFIKLNIILREIVEYFQQLDNISFVINNMYFK